MKKLLIILLLFSAFAAKAQYTPMNAYGYMYKRIVQDSTAHIPSFCGVPTLRNSTATKKSAIAVDTCNKKFYFYDGKTQTWNIVSGEGVSVINIITDSSISICNFNSCDTFYTTITAQLVTILNDSTLRVCDTLFNCDTLHVPRAQFAQTLWDSATIYALVNTKLTASDTTGKWMPFGILLDTTYFVSQTQDSVRAYVYTDGSVIYDTLGRSLLSSITNNITNILQIIDSARSDTSFYISTVLNGDTLLKVRHNPNNRNDTIFFTMVHADATHAGYVSAGGSAGKILHGDGTWRDTTAAVGSQTLQQVFDQETGEALLNKDDTINIQANQFHINGNAGSFRVKVDNSPKFSTLFENGNQILGSTQDNTGASIISSFGTSSNLFSAQTQASSTLMNLSIYKDSLTIKNNSLTFLKFPQDEEGLMVLPQYGDGNFLTAPAYGLGVTTNGNVVETTAGLTNITGLVTAGTNVTVTGSGTSGSPYIVNSSGSSVTTADSVIVATSLQTVFPFTSVPASKDDFFVTVWGVLVDPDLYTISGGITFLTGLDAGDKVRYHRTK